MNNKSKINNHLCTLFFVLFVSIQTIAQPSNWTYVNTGQNHTILLQTTAIITINGASLDIGDYVGLFYEDNGNLYCGGYTVWTGVNNAVSAWGDDTSSPNKDGFDIGEPFQWKIWDSSSNLVHNAVVTYVVGGPFPNQGTYFHNGMSSVATAMNSSNIIPTISGTSCYGVSDGSINISIVNVTGPFSYSWSNGATTQNISGLSAGVYEVTVTDISLTSDSLTIEVTQPEDLSANTLINESNAFMCMAEAEVFPTGGTGPYTYLWNTVPAQTSQLAELCPGTHNVTITDSNNCQTNIDVIIDTTSQNVIDSVFTLIDTCLISFLPDTVYISNLYYSSGTMLIEWTFEFPLSSFTLTSIYPGYTFPGLYYVGLVVNCPTKSFNSLTFVALYNIPPIIDLTASSSNTSCPGQCDGDIDLTLLNGSPPFSYNWSNGATTQDINSLCAGMYTVTVIDSNGSSSILTHEVYDASEIQVTETVVNLLCNEACNGSVNLSVSGGNSPYTFLWSNGETNNVVNNLCAFDYNVTITDANGCETIASYEITAPPPVIASALTTASTCSCCDDGYIHLTTSGGVFPYEYYWSNGDVTEDIFNLYSGTYVVAITDANGCTYGFVYEILGPAQITAPAIVNDISCNGQSDGSINVMVDGGTAPFIYSWSNGGTTSQVESLSAGSYEVTITDADGCIITSNYDVIEPDILEINEITQNATSFGICDGAIDLSILGGTSPYSIVWSNGEITEDLDNLCAGDYTVTIIDLNNCTQTQTITVTEPSSLFIIDSNSFYCEIHPNPIKENLQLHIANTNSEYFYIEIYNSIGSKIFEINAEVGITNSLEINIPNLIPGVYLAKVYNEDKQNTVLRFIK